MKKNTKEYAIKLSLTFGIIIIAFFICNLLFSIKSETPLIVKHLLTGVMLLIVLHSVFVLLDIPENFASSFLLILGYLLEHFVQACEGVLSELKIIAGWLQAFQKNNIRNRNE